MDRRFMANANFIMLVPLEHKRMASNGLYEDCRYLIFDMYTNTIKGTGHILLYYNFQTRL